MTTTKKPISEVKVGEQIMPPAREVSLWMRRTLAEKGLDESALLLTVVAVDHGTRLGVGIKAQYGKEWTATYAEPNKAHYMTFQAKPTTMWKVKA
jgi:hypothetical protein